MEPKIQFQNIETQEEFFLIFQGLCNIAVGAFNKFEEEFKDIKDHPTSFFKYSSDFSYLMSITFVIMGMRGDYDKFMLNNIRPFVLEKDGFVYDQAYLYKMNDYFAKRFNQILITLESVNKDFAKNYKKIWTNFLEI